MEISLDCEVKCFAIKVKDINYGANKLPGFPYGSPLMPHSNQKSKSTIKNTFQSSTNHLFWKFLYLNKTYD